MLGSLSVVLLTVSDMKLQFIVFGMAAVSHLLLKVKWDQGLVLIMTCANIYLMQTESLIELMLGIETLSLASYAVLIQKNGGPRNSEAALRVAVPGMIGSLLIASGLFLVYQTTGGSEIKDINSAVILGVIIKLAAFPFSLYLVKAFEGAVTGIIVLTSYGKLGLILNIATWAEDFQSLWWWIGISTVLLGAYMMLNDRSEMGKMGALVVGNSGFALLILSMPNEYLEWYMFLSQTALVLLLGGDNINGVIKYIARLVFLGFPMTVMFWVKYGFVFSASVSFFQMVGFLIASSILAIAAIATWGSAKNVESETQIEFSSVAVSSVTMSILTLTLLML